MDNRFRRSFLKNKEVHGNLTNTYCPNQRRSVSNVSRSLNEKHKRYFTRRKRRGTSPHLLQDETMTVRGTLPKKEKSKLDDIWKLYIDGASRSDGSGVGLMLISPGGKEYTYALRFEFEATNNVQNSQLMVNEIKGLFKARQPRTKKYLENVKEVLKGFDIYAIKHIRRNHNKKADALSKLASMTFEHLTKEVLVEVLAKRSISEKEVSRIEVEKGEKWMTPIYEYLINGLLPEDPKEARKVLIRPPQYKLIKGSLYRKSFLTPWLCYIGPSHAENIIEEIHKGSCGFNAEPRSMVVKIMKQGYYWPSMDRDAAKKIQDYTQFGVPQAITLKDDNQFKEGIFADFCSGLKIMQYFSPIKDHVEIMNHIEKQLVRSQQGLVYDLSRVLWVHRTLPRNNQNETSFTLTYSSEAIILTAVSLISKNEEPVAGEKVKRKEGREVASIEEAYYRNKLQRYHNTRSNRSTFKLEDFVLLS
ncbi:reverse transcriptase domain-containing protein [Tanacetum coccineum]